jgi:hypothetical protein
VPQHVGDHYGEDEVIVDRRRLGKLRVLERLSQLSFEEHRAAVSREGAS